MENGFLFWQMNFSKELFFSDEALSYVGVSSFPGVYPFPL
ncbi:hypothetical protein FHS90_003451 [Rufibacter quisquiliarum]|uniref:Uncharacterized protein n=1 Tax=Rufibacter quisquiliarum TaxID=1549639 RepID=A0A839GYG9_9BACT|nr:hypothetical protein [Rufibacter quisquiliarum]